MAEHLDANLLAHRAADVLLLYLFVDVLHLVRVSGVDTAAESGLLSGDTGRTGSYQGDSRTVQGMDLSAL